MSTSHNAWQASCTCTVAARSLRAPSRLDPHRVAPQRSAAERLAAREVGAAQVRARSLAAAAEGLEVDAAEARALNECVQRVFDYSPDDIYADCHVLRHGLRRCGAALCTPRGRLSSKDIGNPL